MNNKSIQVILAILMLFGQFKAFGQNNVTSQVQANLSQDKGLNISLNGGLDVYNIVSRLKHRLGFKVGISGDY